MKTEHASVELAGERAESGTEHVETADVPLDLDNPHSAALEEQNHVKLGWRSVMAIVSLILPIASPIVILTTLGTILFQVGNALGDTQNNAWMLSGWSVASSVSFAIAGNVSDVFGRRYTIIGGQVLSLVGLVVGCAANATLHVVAGNVILGFASGLVFVSYAAIAELLPNKWRGAGIGATEFVFLCPWGPFGALIAVNIFQRTSLSWRLLYIIGIVYTTTGMVGTLWLYFPPPRPEYDFKKSRWQEFMEIDFLGSGMYAAGLTVLLIGFSWAGTQYPWRSGTVLAPIFVGLFMLGLSVLYDFNVPKRPFLPLSMMKQIRDFSLLLVVSFMCGALYYSMASILPQSTLWIFTNDANQIGLLNIPQGVGQIVIGVVGSALTGKVKHIRFQLIFWISIMTIFFAVLAVTVPSHKAAFSALQFFSMGCFPLVTTLCYLVASLNVPLRHLGLAIGLIGTLRSAGGSFGNSILYTVFNSYADDHLDEEIIAAVAPTGFDLQMIGPLIEATVNNAIGIPYSFQSVPGITVAVEEAARLALKQVYAAAFRRVCYVTVAFGVVGVGAACFVRDSSRYLTDHTAVQLQHKQDRRDRAAEDLTTGETTSKSVVNHG